jgi:hypothetical protein
MIVDHPGALAAAIATGTGLDYWYEDSAGTYEVSVSYASIDTLGNLHGFIIGIPALAK